MDQKVYAVLDRKLGEYGNLVMIRNDFAAMRAVADTLQAASEVLWSKHPEDFDLYCVGSFDVTTGVLTPASPRLVATFADLSSGRKDARSQEG